MQLRRKDGLCVLACRFCTSRKGETGGDGWGHPQGVVHMAPARLGCKRAMVGTENKGRVQLSTVGFARQSCSELDMHEIQLTLHCPLLKA